MAEIEIDIDLICNDCNATLEGNWHKGQLYIEPCANCLDIAKNKGYEEAENG